MQVQVQVQVQVKVSAHLAAQKLCSAPSAQVFVEEGGPFLTVVMLVVHVVFLVRLRARLGLRS